MMNPKKCFYLFSTFWYQEKFQLFWTCLCVLASVCKLFLHPVWHEHWFCVILKDWDKDFVKALLTTMSFNRVIASVLRESSINSVSENKIFFNGKLEHSRKQYVTSYLILPVHNRFLRSSVAVILSSIISYISLGCIISRCWFKSSRPFSYMNHELLTTKRYGKNCFFSSVVSYCIYPVI